MSWWTKHRHQLNPVHFIDDLLHWGNEHANPEDAGINGDVRIEKNTALNGEQIEQYNQTMDYTNAINENNTEYLDKQYKGDNMANTATTEEQNWFERNQEYIMPLLTTALTTGMQMWYNGYQQDKQNDFNAEQAQLNRDYNSAEADKNRNWQENMSNTAITRQVQDLQNAGINPILASQLGGSAVTAGSQASGTPASSAGLMPMSMKDIMSTALTQSQIDNINADTDLKAKNSGKTEEERKMIEFDRKFKEETRHIEIALQNYRLTKNQYEQMIDDATSRIYAAEANIAEANEKTITRNRRWHEIRDSITSFIPFASPVASSAVRRPTTINNY